jgi:AraC-like DNA-binding protein
LILNIALSSGFGSLSRFNEAFRQAFGCTPREYRKLHRLE